MTAFDLPAGAEAWLAQARTQPVGEVFPAVARKVGRVPLQSGWTIDQAVRALLLIGVPAPEVLQVYRYGDAAEKQAVLQALWLEEISTALGDQALPIIDDAIRTNDQRLLSAAMGPYATKWLSQASFRQAVLKCVFAGVPLAAVDGLPARADDELVRMMTDFAAERAAAGREIPADLEPYLTASSPRRGV
jgi:hypothetical protein